MKMSASNNFQWFIMAVLIICVLAMVVINGYVLISLVKLGQYKLAALMLFFTFLNSFTSRLDDNLKKSIQQ